MKQRFFIRLSYNGNGFHGWQRQNNKPSVQQCLEEHFSTLLRQTVEFTGAGRTDASVHASNYYAHSDFDLQEFTRADLVYKINRFLPQSIVVHDAIPVKENAHARFDAISRTYKYYISKEKTPFYNHLSWFYSGPLDVVKMNEAAKLLWGKKDFKSFSKTGMDVNNYLCDVTEAFWSQDGDILVFQISANRFLRNMVRAIVGTLVDVGRGHISVNYISEILKAQDRGFAGTSVPGHGLFLTDITYPDTIFE